MLKKFLSIGLILASAASAAAAAPAPFVPTTTAEPAASCTTASQARPVINCGFICDSFGRCRRVCW